MLDFKIVVVGDSAVGKTCLIRTHINYEFPSEHVDPTKFDKYSSNVKIMKDNYNITIFDTAGLHDYKRLRSLSYPNTDVLIICFAVDLRDSFSNVDQKWIPEVKDYCPKTPILLVGTKCDLCIEGSRKFITYDEGKKLCKKIGAFKYMECSARLKMNVSEVFDKALRYVVVNMSTQEKKFRKKDEELKKSAELVHKLGECNPS